MPDSLQYKTGEPTTSPQDVTTQSTLSGGEGDTIIQKKIVRFQPQYYTTLDDVSRERTTNPATDYPIAVLPPPQGLLGMKKIDLPTRNDGVTILIVCSFLLVGWAFRSGVKLFGQMIKAIFQPQRNSRSVEYKTLGESKLRIFLLLQAFVLEGITLYYAQHHFWFKIPALGQFPIIASLAFLILACFIIQLLIYRLLGYIFFEEKWVHLCIDNYLSVNSLLGIVLFPVLLFMVYLPPSIEICLFAAVTFYILSRIIFIFRSVNYFLKDMYGIIYFILYLCALEIAPLFLLFRGVEFLCNFVELKIL